MTEAEYLSSTDPAALRTLLVERGLWTKKKCRAFVEACRWAQNTAREPDSWNIISGGYGANWVTLAEYWCQRMPWTGEIPDPRASFIREIWGNPWKRYGFAFDTLEWAAVPHIELRFINPDWLTNGLVPELAKAAVTRECECGGMSPEDFQYCGKCNGTGTTPITGPIDPFRLAVLADALEEAGCTDDGILGHLRATEWACECRQCINGGRPSCECRKSGTRPASHIWTPSGGCWVLQALLR